MNQYKGDKYISDCRSYLGTISFLEVHFLIVFFGLFIEKLIFDYFVGFWFCFQVLIFQAIADSQLVELAEDMLVRSRDHPEMWPLMDGDKQQFSDHTVDSCSDLDKQLYEDLAGYRFYEGGNTWLEQATKEGQSGQNHWDESESGQFDGDNGWSEESTEEVDEVSEMDSSFSKITDEMARVSLEVVWIWRSAIIWLQATRWNSGMLEGSGWMFFLPNCW